MVTRREAISVMALASGAMIVPKGCVSDEGKKEPSRFSYSLNTSTISGQSSGILKYIEVAAEAGYDYVEVWVRDVKEYINAGHGTAALKRYINDHGIKIASAIGFAPWMTGGEAGFAQMEEEMELLAEIGCPRIAAPPAGVDPANPLDLLAMGEKYRELAELGRKTGVFPQLEFWGASEVLWHMGQVLMIAAAANIPDVKILPDIYHLFRGGSGFESLKMLKGNLIDLFHLNDYPGTIPRLKQVDADRVYPGDGIAPLSQVLTDLKNMGGEKILSLELFNREYWKQEPLVVAETGL
ncbi:MAG: TIM barrel protein, partial [Bacteroidales bacterium]